MPQPKSDVIAEVVRTDIPDVPSYSDEDKNFISGLQIRLQRARNIREQPCDEFDGMNYPEYWEANERWGNTFTEPRKNPEDSTFQSGTIRRKLKAFLSELLQYDFYADVVAFNEQNIEVKDLGNVLEDAIVKSNEMDGDDEKRMLRQYEMVKQGDVFVEKVWDEQFIKEKKFKGATFDGKITGVSWVTKLKRKWCGPHTNILSGMSVLLGSMSVYDINDQPYIAVTDYLDYEDARSRYEKWERWPFVSKTLREFSSNRERSMLFNNWRLFDFQKNKVERIRYQDAKGNEFALVLNGVLMTPPGLPLPWGYEGYNVTQQHMMPIRADFAYGSSLIKELRGNVAMLDDLIRIMHLIQKKALVPARFNLTGRTLSRRVFLPGAITANIKPGEVPLADEQAAKGLGAGEFNFVQMLSRNIDDNSVGNIPSGQEPSNAATATEVLEVSKAARIMFNHILIAAQLLEWKLSWLTLYTILAKWFDPTGDRVDEVRQEVVKTYKNFGVSRPIDDKGMGHRNTYIMEGELPRPGEIRTKEQELEAQTGSPYKLLFVNPDAVTSSKWVWGITIRTKPKPNDERSRLMLERFIATTLQLFGPDVNVAELQADYAIANDRDPKKLFTRQSPVPMPGAPGAPQAPGMVAPNVEMPQANPMQ